MSDIVERLRNAFPHGHENTDVPTYADDVLMHEAAAEIERLRAALQDIAEDPYAIDGGAADIARRALEGTRHQPGT